MAQTPNQQAVKAQAAMARTPDQQIAFGQEYHLKQERARLKDEKQILQRAPERIAEINLLIDIINDQLAALAPRVPPE